jgi:hypothetical protein
MSFLRDTGKDFEVVLLSDLPEDTVIHEFKGRENRRNEYKQIMVDVSLDSTTSRFDDFSP